MAVQNADKIKTRLQFMEYKQCILCKSVIIVGLCIIIFHTLFPPRVYIDTYRLGRRERLSRAFLFSRNFHQIERNIGSETQRKVFSIDGHLWTTTSLCDPASLDWARYILESILILAATCLVCMTYKLNERCHVSTYDTRRHRRLQFWNQRHWRLRQRRP